MGVWFRHPPRYDQRRSTIGTVVLVIVVVAVDLLLSAAVVVAVAVAKFPVAISAVVAVAVADPVETVALADNTIRDLVFATPLPFC